MKNILTPNRPLLLYFVLFLNCVPFMGPIATSLNASTPTFLVDGCTDMTACNYNPDATTDDGSCEYGIATCDEPCNAIVGCTNPFACNYDADANCDDGSCDYGNADCPSPCTDITGCTNPLACNYNAEASCDDGSCAFPPCNVAGCTDPCAANYNPDASIEDGSCEPYDTTCNTDCTLGDIEAWDATSCSCMVVDTIVYGCLSFEACNFNPDANCNDGSCSFIVEANAGPDQNVCGFTTTLEANEEEGVWTTFFGGVSFEDATNPQTTVTVSQAGSYVFFWNTFNNCPDTDNDQDPVSVLFLDPYLADAGGDASTCSQAYPLNANTPEGLAATGTWTVVEGTGNFNDSSSPNAIVTGLSEGNNTFQWTVSGPLCYTVSDSITVTVVTEPIPANAGEDALICGNTYQLQASELGAWSGDGNFDNINDPLSTVSVNDFGTYTFIWTVSNECGTSMDSVNITFSQNMTEADAGPDQTVCGFTTTLEAVIEPENTGMWISNFGGVTFADVNDPTTQVTVDQPGPFIFFWQENAMCGNEEVSDSDLVSITFQEEDSEACQGGCTDPCAINYNADAVTDDGSCLEYSTDCDDGCILTSEFYDSNTCQCVFIQPTCFGEDDCASYYFDETTCECASEPLCATIIGNVFFDENNNSIQDTMDTDVENLIVLLYDDQGDVVAQTTTDINGEYFFVDIPEGYYYLFFSVPSSFVVVEADVSGDDAIDSDINSNGTTEVFEVVAGDFISDIDLGITTQSITCEDFGVFVDVICNDENYELILSFDVGGEINEYLIIDNQTGEEIITNQELVFLGPFEFGTGYSYTIIATSNTQCLEQFNQAVIDCVATAVELLGFEGENTPKGNLLKWQTASEENNEYFKLMHSTDGLHFEEINRQRGAGNSQATLSYQYLDVTASEGLNYYRLDQVDSDGKESSSTILVLENLPTDISILDVYPNPATTFLNVQFESLLDQPTQMNVYNTQGSLIESMLIQTNKGLNQINLDIADLMTGLYFIELTNDNTLIQRTRFVKNP